jgi:GntR family transcriptional regulator
VQGKGTFVALNPPRRLTPVRYAGFLEELQERVLKLKVTGVEMATVTAAPELKSLLNLAEDETEVTLIKRLRHIDDEPFSFTLNYLPLHIGRRIREKDLFTVPLLRILQDELKIPIVRARETIEAAPADPEIAHRLGISVLHPVMHMKRVMYTTKDRPFELVETYYRADKYHYSVNLIRVKRQGKWTWRTEVETSA